MVFGRGRVGEAKLSGFRGLESHFALAAFLSQSSWPQGVNPGKSERAHGPNILVQVSVLEPSDACCSPDQRP